MKRNRIVFVILWIASLVGISFFGGAVSYGFFLLLTMTPVILLLYLALVMSFFRIYQELGTNRLVADHTVPFQFKLINEYPFGFAGIRVRFYSSFSTISGLDDGIEYELLPMTGIERETSLVCKYRGEYEIGIKTVEMQDFFRLFRLSYHNREALRVVVRPNLIELDSLRAMEMSQILNRSSDHHPSEPDTLVRKYVPGDDIRRINWKSSARSGELLVRSQIGEEQEGVGVLLGTCRPGKDPKQYLPVENKMLEAALALTLFFAKKNMTVHSFHMVMNPEGAGLDCRTVSGLEQFEQYYETLSRIEFREDLPEALLLEQAGGRHELFLRRVIFMVLHEWSPGAAVLAKLLNENNVSVVIYLIRDEIPEEDSVERLPRTALVRLGTDEDLTEVM